MTSFSRIVLPVATGTVVLTLLAGCSTSGTDSAGPSPSAPVTASASEAGTASAAPSETPTTPEEPSASPTATEAAGHNDADVSFAKMMIPHHLQAIDMAGLARTQAGDQWIRDLAAKIVDAQDPEIRTIKGWLDGWGEEPHPRDHAMPGMLSEAEIGKLAKADGSAFDRLFVTMMIKHHQGAIKMAEEERASGAFAEATALADTIVTTQAAEIKEMKAYLAKLK
ncbi:DUF305 domain-containing protein [Microtetraspora sp. AC03309]|uniref:DUF305 domain-containing protein n=1 Tax=Microtetraspora sp. AC03309 TaxID=2779376 RepID=UPI001E4BF9B9|nr:DUF305 domain-containing protein [Microtetraspora sp. AC03309]MCC5574171.1 DUF305 domain-containing protein [Microtetraspora sp. AC03309]